MTETAECLRVGGNDESGGLEKTADWQASDGIGLQTASATKNRTGKPCGKGRQGATGRQRPPRLFQLGDVLAQNLVDARLPTLAAGAEFFDHIGGQAYGNNLLYRLFLFASR